MPVAEPSGETGFPERAEGEILLHEKDYERALIQLQRAWLAKPGDGKTVCLLAELMKELDQAELAELMQNLSLSMEAGNADPQLHFEVGFRLIDLRLFELAAMNLERSAEAFPKESVIHYELGYALMSSRRFEQAISSFERARSGGDDFDTLLNLAVCNVCLRRSERAKDLLKSMPAMCEEDEQRREMERLNMVIKRLDRFADKKQLSVRDWMFIQYGSVLLRQSPDKDSGGRFAQVLNDYSDLALVCLSLLATLQTLEVQIDEVEYYSHVSKPLAETLGELLGVPVNLYRGPALEGRALLVMAWAGDIVGPHKSFMANDPQRVLFAYGLSTLEPLPVTPDIVGLLAESSAMPWDEQWTIERHQSGQSRQVEHKPAAKTSEDAVKRLAKLSRDLESDPDMIRTLEEIVNYFLDKSSQLVLDNSSVFPERPPYTAEVW
jgi:tetratricopeptide (TPR) repeat protein